MQAAFSGEQQSEKVIGSPQTQRIDVEVVLNATIEALSNVNAERLDELAFTCERITSGITYLEACEALEAHRVLQCLLEHTQRNIKLLTISHERREEYSRPSYNAS